MSHNKKLKLRQKKGTSYKSRVNFNSKSNLFFFFFDSEQTATAEEKDTPVNIKPGQQGKPSSAPTDNTSSKVNAAGTKSQGGINLELIGEYNGQPITDVDLDDVEDKPWRKPGADITDYFNYGFNEVSWRSYCAKQKMLRENKKVKGINATTKKKKEKDIFAYTAAVDDGRYGYGRLYVDGYDDAP